VQEPLRLQLSTLPQGGSAVEMELAAREIDLAMPDAEFVDPVRVALEIFRQDEQLQVRGTASVAIRQVCVRCLRETERELAADVSVVASARAQRDAGEEAPDGLIYHDGEIVDLTGEIRELLLLEVPTAPVCRAQCLGLCPRCGADLNEGPCGCGAGVNGDARWAALQALAARAAATPLPAKIPVPEKAAEKKVAPEKAAPKKVAPKKAAPKKAAPKKAAPGKVPPKKAAPKKVTPKKVAPKKVASKTTAPGKTARKKQV
jgi:uncharacterized metal-binding protein YceD (DUF177 family)